MAQNDFVSSKPNKLSSRDRFGPQFIALFFPKALEFILIYSFQFNQFSARFKRYPRCAEMFAKLNKLKKFNQITIIHVLKRLFVNGFFQLFIVLKRLAPLGV
jgi:hypothetical protein